MSFSIKLKVFSAIVLGNCFFVLILAFVLNEKPVGLRPIMLALVLSVSVSWLVLIPTISNLRKRINALYNGLLNFMDNEFSTTIHNSSSDEIGDVIECYNRLGETLRKERQHVHQRELLLDTVIQNSSMSVLLCDDSARVIYANHTARELLASGRAITGLPISKVLEGVPESLREAVNSGQGGLFNLEGVPEQETYHLTQGHFVLNGRRHFLYLIKVMTREINKQEVATWKEAIRLISHELNNSLAPISSLAHSGHLMIQKDRLEKLPDVFTTIAERAEHLKAFIDGYIHMAKLPLPIKKNVDWRDLVSQLQKSMNFRVIGEIPERRGFFDLIQMEQVLVNLLKNANESGSAEEEITLQIEDTAQYVKIEVADAGQGMSSTVMKNALLPFYTTKSSGSGVGLPLCRDIVEAHDGKFTIANREKRGVVVSIWLQHKPDSESEKIYNF